MAGGLTKGKSHAKGGIKMKVKSTGQNIEVEGGEGIINKHTMSSKDKHTFEGKEMTACEIASKLNQKTGNGVSFDCDETKNTDMTPTDPSTGFAKGGKTKKRKYKKKKMAKSKKKTGAFGKLVSKIMKRDGIPYKQALAKAKDEYVSGATSQKKQPKKSYKGRLDKLKSKSAPKKSYSGKPKKAKGGKTKEMYFIETGMNTKSGEKKYTYEQGIKRIKSLLKDDKDLLGGRKLSSLSDDDIIELGFNHYGFDYADNYAKGGSLPRTTIGDITYKVIKDGNGYNVVSSKVGMSAYKISSKPTSKDEAKELFNRMVKSKSFAKGGMIRIESGNKGKTRVVYNKKKEYFTELEANEIFDEEKLKGKSVFIFVDNELYDSYIADGDEDMYAKGGEVMSRESIVEILKDRLEPVADEIESDFETYNNNGEEVEYQSRDGFIPFTDGGYEYDLFATMSMLITSGKSLPTQALDDELERQDNYNYELAQENFFNTYSDDEDFIKRFPSKEDINYSDLYDYDDIIAEEFDSYRFDSDDSVLFGVSAFYYKPDNYRGVEGSHSIRLTGYVNLESPYHRRGRLEDSKEILFTFDSLKQLENKLAINILTIMEWFKGKEYDLSTKSLYAKGGHLDNARERIIDYFINNEEDEELISRMGGDGEELLEDRDKNFDEIYEKISNNYDDDDIEYYFEMYLDDGSGSGHLAKGGVTKNNQIIEQFLDEKTDNKLRNISIHYADNEDLMLLRNYGTLIATRKGTNVKVSDKKYSSTTSTIQNAIVREAENRGMNVTRVREGEFAKGGKIDFREKDRYRNKIGEYNWDKISKEDLKENYEKLMREGKISKDSTYEEFKKFFTQQGAEVYAKGGDVSGKPVVESLDKIVTHYNSGDDFDLDNYPPKYGYEWMSDAMELSLEDAKQFAKELDYELEYSEDVEDAKTLHDLQYAILEDTQEKANQDNTYNVSWWGGVVDFFVLERKEDEGYGEALVILRMHRGGDPRGNYGGYEAFKVSSFIEDFPPYNSQLTYQIETNQGRITLDTEDMEGYSLLVVEDETGTFEVDDYVSIDDVDEKLDMNKFSIYAKGGQTKKFNNGGNIMDKKLELAKSLSSQVDIDFEYLDWDEINSFDDLYEQLDNNDMLNEEIIYYGSAMDYLRQNDPSLKESLELAGQFGYTPENLNSEILASILATENLRDDVYKLRSEVDDFFDELED